MNGLIASFKSLLNDESGATLVEYALIVSLIAIAAIAAVTTLSGKVQATLNSASAQLQ